MPTLDDLIALLSGIHISDRNRYRANTVASHLVRSIWKDHWHQLSPNARQKLDRASTKRLWESYMHIRKFQDYTPKDAAERAIHDEIATLEEILNQV